MKIDTSDECVAKMLHALPFADNNAGLDETAELIRLLHAENKALKDEIEGMHQDAAGADI
jgi:hypothetical protein